MAKRDLVTNLGDTLIGCSICCGKTPKLVWRSLRRLRSSVFPRYSLKKTSQAQDDRLDACFGLNLLGRSLIAFAFVLLISTLTFPKSVV